MSIRERIVNICGEGCIPEQSFSKPMMANQLMEKEEREAVLESLPSGENRFYMRLYKTAKIKGWIPTEEE